MPNGIIITDI